MIPRVRTAADLPDGVRELVIEGREAWPQRDYDRARVLFEQALAAAATLNDPFAEISALDFLGNVAFNQCRDNESRRLHETALALARREGDEQGIATSLGSLALVDAAEGRLDDAHEKFGEAVASYTRAGMVLEAQRVRETADALTRRGVAVESLVNRQP